MNQVLKETSTTSATIASLLTKGYIAETKEIVERIAISTGRNSHNEKYLDTKVGKLGHLIKE